MYIVYLDGKSENVIRMSELKTGLFLNKFQNWNLSCFKQMPYVDQNTHFTTHVRTYFWVTI